MEWIEAQRHDRTRLVRAIAAKEDDRCIGQVGLYHVDARIGSAELGIFIGDKNWQGQGLGKLATTEVLRFAFEELHLHKVWLVVLETNKRAVQIYRQLGFRQDGVLRDEQFRHGQYVNAILMSMLHTEWLDGHAADTK